MSSRLTVYHDADSSSSDSDSSPIRVPRRSATVSPSMRHSFRRPVRRRSDFNLDAERRAGSGGHKVYPSDVQNRHSSERKLKKGKLRKTNSEPSVEQNSHGNSEEMRDLLRNLPKFTFGPFHCPLSDELDSGAEEIKTEIEELRDAAESIQSLQRVLQKGSKSERSDNGEGHSASDSNSNGRVSGISTRLGHPRGVMQFLPSIRTGDGYSRKESLTEPFLGVDNLFAQDAPSPRQRRRAMCEEMYESGALLDKGSGALEEFSRLLKSFRSGPQETTTTPSWEKQMYNGEQRADDSPLLQADILLWKKRSRASLRRHNSVRNMAAKELFDTEQSFVDGLQYLVQKYMRPLRQPLECRLIDASLVDKIFYKIPEVLAHHQFLLAALSSRLEEWHQDSVLGDVLLAHFSKQSMVETYISFVDNFKHAKHAIAQARLKPSFEKYYQRCSREHPNKLDLDALLISPIQRVPRYELIIKQILKHTPTEHEDHERLLRAERLTHQLAVAINRQRVHTEQMEQRLREIEAIVDGLDDLVSSDRNLLRYDMVTLKCGSDAKQRCVFTLSDQLILTSVRRKIPGNTSRPIIQSADFLDSNRFKLLIKISLEDVEIGKDTLGQLRETERCIQICKEDRKILGKMVELSNLLSIPHQILSTTLNDLESSTSQQLRALSEQITTDPELTTVHLNVITSNGIERIGLEFGSAEKRCQWETAFMEAKDAIASNNRSAATPILKSVLPHQSRPGLQMCAATVVPGKRAESAPSVWICSSDKFSGQVAVVSLDGNPSIDSCAGIGNSSIVAVTTVPPPARKRKRSLFRMDSSIDKMSTSMTSSIIGDSTESDESEMESEGPTTVWIGNDDGEVFVINSTERVRTRARDRVARLSLPVTAICYTHACVYVASASHNMVQLVAFSANSDVSWDLERPARIPLDVKRPISAMIGVGKALCVGSGNQLLTLCTQTNTVQQSLSLLEEHEQIGHLHLAGALLFVCAKASTTIHAVDAFALTSLNKFSISSTVLSQLTGGDDIIRDHKMGSLRVSCLLACKSMLWIGTSAGYVLGCTLLQAKCDNQPILTVLETFHSGPCRLLLSVSLQQQKRNRKTSLNVPSQQNAQTILLSCGEGVENREGGTVDPMLDAVNHIVLWNH